MELILNDISIDSNKNDINSARERMNSLILVCQNAISHGVERSLRTKENFFHQEISPDYRVVQWLNDSKVDKEYQRYFKTLAQKAPYIDDELEYELFEKTLSVDFKFRDSCAMGLGAAYLLNSLSISFKDGEKWDMSLIPLLMEYIDDETGEILTEEIIIRHASGLDHIEDHKNWFNEQNLNKIHDGNELWKSRGVYFPHLIFCDSVEDQVATLHIGQSVFRQILKRLNEINNYFSSWQGGVFNQEEIPSKVTPQGTETLKLFESDHTFKCPDGVERVFSWHSRMTPGAWRLFFYPEEQSKKGIVGYIGTKLPTVTDPK